MEKTIALLSPSDVDRNEVKNAIVETSKNMENLFDATSSVTFKVIEWPDLPPVAENRSGQYTVDEYIAKSDIVIAIFQSKIGTKFNNEKSATIHEINSALLKYIRKRYTGTAPQIMIYFCKSQEAVGKLSVEELENHKQVLEAKEMFNPYGLNRTCENNEELLKRIKNDLKNIAHIFIHKHNNTPERFSGEQYTFLENLIEERVFSWLEMDNGFSEKIVKLFDNFYYGDEKSKYQTNFIFNYNVLKNTRLKLMSERFRDVFAYWICEMIDIYNHKIKEEKGEVFEQNVSFKNFANYATIVCNDDIKNAPCSYERLQDENGIQFLNDIAKALNTKIWSDFEKTDDSNGCPNNRKGCPTLLEREKPLVFITHMLSETFLKNTEAALSLLLPDDYIENDKCPVVYLLSVVEIPGKDEFQTHLRKSSDNLPCLLKLSRFNKLFYKSYLLQSDLNSPKILAFINPDFPILCKGEE